MSVAEAANVAPRFKPGDVVSVHDRAALGHCRAPWYLRGRRGVVAEVQGAFRDPERLAYHKPGLPALVLYKVRFTMADLWFSYDGPAHDHLDADLTEDWLRPAAEPAAQHPDRGASDAA